jgi:hypothetical protein
MPHRISRALIALVGCLLAAAPLGADPRWWRNDQRLTFTTTEAVTPHIAPIGYGTGAPPGSFVVTWSQVDPVGGDLEVWLTASFDGGCTFCAPTRLTDDTVDDTRPRAAAYALPSTGFLSVAVAFEQSGKVVVAWDSSTLDFHLPSDQWCTKFAGVGPAIVSQSQYVVFGAPGSVADQPDITSAWTYTWGHYHLVWHDTRDGGDDIFYAHDLTAAGGAGWTNDPVKNLTLASPPGTVAGRPAITGDILTDPDPTSGSSTASRSGVNVVFVDTGGAAGDRLLGLRSVDSGYTFSPSGVRIDQPAADVADPPQNDRRRPPDIAAAWSPGSFTATVWVATAWDQLSSGSTTPDIRLDARYVDTPATAAPDWQTPDEAVSTASAADEGRVAVAVPSKLSPTVAPVYVFWEDTRFGPREIVGRSGRLDPAAADVIDLGRPRFDPVRLLDPTTSTDFQLTHCVFDPVTFACDPARTVGDAREVASASDMATTYVVWSDTRDGHPEIYFKRDDWWVSMAPARLATGCSAPGIAYINATFDVVPTCANTNNPDRLIRYLVYYGTDPGGPFLNAANPVVIPQSPLLGATVTVRLDGLVPATTYSVIVVPEDEAHNVYPSRFDPLADLAAPQTNEVQITTPGPCDQGDEICLYRSDVTVLDPLTPPPDQIYLTPPTVEGISLQGLPYQCPFASGDLEGDATAVTNGVPLILHQVNEPVSTLTLVKSGTTICFEF